MTRSIGSTKTTRDTVIDFEHGIFNIAKARYRRAMSEIFGAGCFHFWIQVTVTEIWTRRGNFCLWRSAMTASRPCRYPIILANPISIIVSDGQLLLR